MELIIYFSVAFFFFIVDTAIFSKKIAEKNEFVSTAIIITSLCWPVAMIFGALYLVVFVLMHTLEFVSRCHIRFAKFLVSKSSKEKEQ